MKIQKFNESYRGDKVIKIYNNSILHDYQVEKDDLQNKINILGKKLEDSKVSILNLINEYVKMNKEHFHKRYPNYMGHQKIKDFHFYIDEKDKTPNLSLIQHDWKDDKFWLIYKDIEGLLNFINNPDVYRDTKKYNL